MKLICKIIGSVSAFSMLLQACGPSANQKIMAAKTDSLFIKVRCVKTVSELIENTLLIPAQKKLQYKIDYINETYPDTITKKQAEKIMQIKNVYDGYDELIFTSKELQKKSALQLLQVSKLNAETVRDENTLQYLTFESKCADSLNTVLNVLIKKSIELSCKSQAYN